MINCKERTQRFTLANLISLSQLLVQSINLKFIHRKDKKNLILIFFFQCRNRNIINVGYVYPNEMKMLPREWGSRDRISGDRNNNLAKMITRLKLLQNF
jgi:hypothetical protein